MNLFPKAILSILWVFPLITSCGTWISVTAGKATPETEMFRWTPPTQQELAYRRERQRELDAIEADIRARYLFQESLISEETVLLASLRVTGAQIASLEPEVQKKIDELKQIIKQIQIKLKDTKTRNIKLSEKVEAYKKSLIPKRLTADNYVKAINFFQMGEYRNSVSAFKAMLKDNPPKFLRDNIYFGLANAFYKMEKWKSAEKYFNLVVKEYPLGNKWPASYLMLALIHNSRNEKSKALYILDKALKKRLSDSMSKLIKDLRNSIQRKFGDVKS